MHDNNKSIVQIIRLAFENNMYPAPMLNVHERVGFWSQEGFRFRSSMVQAIKENPQIIPQDDALFVQEPDDPYAEFSRAIPGGRHCPVHYWLVRFGGDSIVNLLNSTL
ncbi:hypothetical protein AKJ16_DCAP08135 [Drosera capensis]